MAGTQPMHGGILHSSELFALATLAPVSRSEKVSRLLDDGAPTHFVCTHTYPCTSKLHQYAVISVPTLSNDPQIDESKNLVNPLGPQLAFMPL
jgi:hypothetical protein